MNGFFCGDLSWCFDFFFGVLVPVRDVVVCIDVRDVNDWVGGHGGVLL